MLYYSPTKGQQVKRIQILTFYDVINRGSVLQAYGLLLHMQELFPEYVVTIAKYNPIALRLYELCRSLKPKNQNFGNFKRYLKIKKDIATLLRVDKTPFKQLIGKFTDNDIIISGSDCIWQITHKFPYPRFPNYYWQDFATQAQKIAYSSSAFGSDMNLVTRYQKDITRLLKNYSLISVRDSFTKKITGGEGIYITPDPSFFVKLDPSIRYNVRIENLLKTQKKKIGIQLYHKRRPEQIKRFLDSRKGSLLIGLTDNFKMPNTIDGELNTLQWANFFGQMDFMITDSFHGMLFSLRNKTPFISIERPGVTKACSKAYHVLNLIDLEELYIDLESDRADDILLDKQAWIEKNWETALLPKLFQGLKKIETLFDTYDQQLKGIIR